MRLRVGLTALTSSIEEYARRFDLLELRGDPRRLPSDKALRRMKATAGELVELSFLVPAEATARGADDPAVLAPLWATVASVEPAWVVLQTGATMGPSARSRARLQALIAAAQGPGRRIAWEPRGPFEPALAREWSDALGVSFVEDLSQPSELEPAPTVYTRLRAEGPGARLTAGALERLAEQLAPSEEACVVIEGRPSPRARTRVRQAIESLGFELGAADDELEEEAEEDDELEDEQVDGSEDDDEESSR